MVSPKNTPLFVRDRASARYVRLSPEEVLARARDVALQRLQPGRFLGNLSLAARLIIDRMRGLEHEVFAMLCLDSRNRLIRYIELFRGTIDGASVHTREVVKAALQSNAAFVIFAHNHPSGHAEPSQADETITQRLREALALVDIRAVDHIIAAGEMFVSFMERGIMERPSWVIEQEREVEERRIQARAERRAGRRKSN
jgi:DNA repair protein RadC